MEDMERYIEEIVKPTIEDFDKDRTCVRRAFLACLTTFHTIDYLAHPRSPRGLRQKFRRNRDFEIVDDVAHAFKHVVSGKRSAPNLTAADVISRPPGMLDVMVFDLSRFDDPVGGVTLDKARDIDLYEVVCRALKYVTDASKTAQGDSRNSTEILD